MASIFIIWNWSKEGELICVLLIYLTFYSEKDLLISKQGAFKRYLKYIKIYLNLYSDKNLIISKQGDFNKEFN